MLNIVVAVLIGVVIAVVLFLLWMSRSVIRRAYRGDTVPSRRMRDPAQRAILAHCAACIHVLELEGAIFFGTAERLAAAIEDVVRVGARFVVLDLRRVTDVDMTGGPLLTHVHEHLAGRGGHLLITNLDEHTHWGRMLSDLGVTTAVSRDRPFPDADHAIEWAEDQLIAAGADGDGMTVEVDLAQIDAFSGLGESELATVRSMLDLRHYRKGDVVITEGAEDAELFIVVRGSASVYVQRADGRATRLASFSAGTSLGEMALLDRQPRSATVVADEDLMVYVLSHSAFQELKARRPAIAIDLVTNLARDISSRLRRATRTIHQLVS